MGFRNQGLGNIHECWVENGMICEKSPFSDITYKYPTRLQLDIPKQLNLFVSPLVAFYLKHEGNVYIGRYDGSISIYRESDMLLVGLNNWDAPDKVATAIIGFQRCSNGLREVLLDLRDRQTVYVDYHDIEAYLTTPFLGDETSLQAFGEFNDMGSWYVVTERGEVIGVSVWNIQNDVWRRNCPVFF